MRVGRQLPWFVVFGVAASATHVTVGTLLVYGLNIPALTANAIAYVTALLVSYVGNTVVTFRVAPWRLAAFTKFAVISVAGFIVNQFIVHWLHDQQGWPYLLSLLVVLAVVPPFTFVMARVWALAE